MNSKAVLLGKETTDPFGSRTSHVSNLATIVIEIRPMKTRLKLFANITSCRPYVQYDLDIRSFTFFFLGGGGGGNIHGQPIASAKCI